MTHRIRHARTGDGDFSRATALNKSGGVFQIIDIAAEIVKLAARVADACEIKAQRQNTALGQSVAEKYQLGAILLDSIP